MRHATLLVATTLTTATIGISGASAQMGSNSCASPNAISGIGSFPWSTVGATTDGTAAVLCNFFNNSQVYNDVWFCWTASESGLLKFTTCGASFDTKLAVYLGCNPCPDESTLIACNDDATCASGPTLRSIVTVGVEAGESYTVRIGAYAATVTGTGNLTIESGAMGESINPANNHRYVLYSATTWSGAEATAQMLGGHLVAINDAEESAWIQTEFGLFGGVNRRIWIGANDVASEGVWAWTTGEPFTFSAWNAGEPNNASGIEHYAEFFGDVALWNDMPDSGGTPVHVALAEISEGGGGGNTCPADIDNDGWVAGSDMAAVLSSWGGTGTADIDGDGIVGGADMAAILGSWGECP
ncbi:MAG: lectin-like protein [Planctomycetota bacterium]|nr:lectin-like protein [Planctomycetota bacterium]MDA1106762.1 lectin-like protein [Planctomycetota bacterium]